MYQDHLPRPASQRHRILRDYNEGPEDQLRVSSVNSKADSSSIIPLQFWDTPASFELENLDVPLSQFSTIVFVLDIQVSSYTDPADKKQDNYYEPIAKLVPTLLKAYAQNQNLNFEVFAHKAEMLSEDYRQGRCGIIQADKKRTFERFRTARPRSWMTFRFYLCCHRPLIAQQPYLCRTLIARLLSCTVFKVS